MTQVARDNMKFEEAFAWQLENSKPIALDEIHSKKTAFGGEWKEGDNMLFFLRERTEKTFMPDGSVADIELELVSAPERELNTDEWEFESKHGSRFPILVEREKS